MKFYFGIKFREDLSNKDLIERICNIAEQRNHQIICDHRDLEQWGKRSFSMNKLMEKTFEIIENSDAVIIEFSESGVGLGIEAGFSAARNVPVYILLPKGRKLSPTMKGICKNCFEYETDEDIRQMFRSIETA
jgi:nucleoside 2-deoxyribosyltransferase